MKLDNIIEVHDKHSGYLRHLCWNNEYLFLNKTWWPDLPKWIYNILGVYCDLFNIGQMNSNTIIISIQHLRWFAALSSAQLSPCNFCFHFAWRPRTDRGQWGWDFPVRCSPTFTRPRHTFSQPLSTGVEDPPHVGQLHLLILVIPLANTHVKGPPRVGQLLILLVHLCHYPSVTCL